MRLLLDTHTVLWWVADDPQLSAPAVAAMLDDANELLLSAAVVWEISIKRSLGKLDAPPELIDQLLRTTIRPLPITVRHAAAVQHLPSHHRDPVDRMLVAQAQLERAAVVSKDDVLRAYGVDVIW